MTHPDLETTGGGMANKDYLRILNDDEKILPGDLLNRGYFGLKDGADKWQLVDEVLIGSRPGALTIARYEKSARQSVLEEIEKEIIIKRLPRDRYNYDDRANGFNDGLAIILSIIQRMKGEAGK